MPAPEVAVSTHNLATSSVAPHQSAEAVVPDDITDIGPFRGLWVGGAGNVVVRFVQDDADVTCNTVAAGTKLDFAVKRVLATGTTATDIVGLR